MGKGPGPPSGACGRSPVRVLRRGAAVLSLCLSVSLSVSPQDLWTLLSRERRDKDESPAGVRGVAGLGLLQPLLRFRRGNESIRSRFIDQYVYIKDEQSKTFLLESDPAKCLQSYQQHEQPGGGNGRGR